jgi:hypothetical protein
MSDNTSRLTVRPKLWHRLRAHPYWKWLTPGIGIKRWLVLFLLGVTLLSLAFAFILVDVYRSADLPGAAYYLTLQFLPRFARAIVVGVVGVAALSIAAYQLSRSILSPFTGRSSKSVAQALVDHRQRDAIAGRHLGGSTISSAARPEHPHAYAIVTVADDGKRAALRVKWVALAGKFFQLPRALAATSH